MLVLQQTYILKLSIQVCHPEHSEGSPGPRSRTRRSFAALRMTDLDTQLQNVRLLQNQHANMLVRITSCSCVEQRLLPVQLRPMTYSPSGEYREYLSLV